MLVCTRFLCSSCRRKELRAIRQDNAFQSAFSQEIRAATRHAQEYREMRIQSGRMWACLAQHVKLLQFLQHRIVKAVCGLCLCKLV